MHNNALSPSHPPPFLIIKLLTLICNYRTSKDGSGMTGNDYMDSIPDWTCRKLLGNCDVCGDRAPPLRNSK